MKKIRLHKTLFEMHLGLLFYGVICQIVGIFFVKNQRVYAISLWFGIVLAGISSIHMYRCLDRGLDSEENAKKVIVTGYMIRYIVFTVILVLVSITKVMNPLVVFMAYMGLKVSAYIQPFTHKLCNKIFNETDPIPVSEEELALEKK